MTEAQMLSTLTLWGWFRHGRTFLKWLPPDDIGVISTRMGVVYVYSDVFYDISDPLLALEEDLSVYYEIAQRYEAEGVCQ